MLRLLATLILVCALGGGSSAAELAHGRVVGVVDGDSLRVLISGIEVEIRLAEIDAPERGQPYGAKAKKVLSDLVFGRDVVIAPTAVDRYGRTVAKVSVDNRYINLLMIELGAAWVYTAYSDDPVLLQVEAHAKAEHVGLWGLAEYEQVPPWEWRRGRRASLPTTPGIEAYSCNTKRYCREMTSCDEATWYLKECGIGTLDGDGDGVACENLCGG